MSLRLKLKEHFTKDLLSQIIDKNSSDNLYVDYYGVIADLEREMIKAAYMALNRKKSKTADELNLNRTTFHMKFMKLLGDKHHEHI